MSTDPKGYDLTIPVSDFILSYDDLGEGEMPVIFLHGYPFSKAMWKQQLEFLQSAHRVIACDIRGFGKSTHEEGTLSMDLFADDLLTFMYKLQIEKAIICGLSMGGYIALNAVERFPTHFEALILCDTQCIADSPEGKEKRYKVIDDIKANGVKEFNEKFINSVFHKDTLSNNKELVESLRTVVFANSQQVIIAGLTALAERAQTCSTLGAISIPTLILCGREDEVTPLAQSEFMHQLIDRSTLHVIEKAGHVSNLEHPDEFNQQLLGFLTSYSTMGTGLFPLQLESIK
jgi:3-oxoadipate enol-lactonase